MLWQAMLWQAGGCKAVVHWRSLGRVPASCKRWAYTALGHGRAGLRAKGDIKRFALRHAFVGVAVGEYPGQPLTAFHVVLVAQMQQAEPAPRSAWLGRLTAAAVTTGAFEGVVLSVGSVFGLVAVAGYLGLTLWMLASSGHLMRGRRGHGHWLTYGCRPYAPLASSTACAPAPARDRC